MTEKQKRCIDKFRDYFENQEDIAYVNIMNKLADDAKFERLVKSMTVDRLTGGASHEKHIIKWDKR